MRGVIPKLRDERRAKPLGRRTKPGCAGLVSAEARHPRTEGKREKPQRLDLDGAVAPGGETSRHPGFVGAMEEKPARVAATLERGVKRDIERCDRADRPDGIG